MSSDTGIGYILKLISKKTYHGVYYTHDTPFNPMASFVVIQNECDDKSEPDLDTDDFYMVPKSSPRTNSNDHHDDPIGLAFAEIDVKDTTGPDDNVDKLSSVLQSFHMIAGDVSSNADDSIEILSAYHDASETVTMPVHSQEQLDEPTASVSLSTTTATLQRSMPRLIVQDRTGATPNRTTTKDYSRRHVNTTPNSSRSIISSWW